MNEATVKASDSVEELVERYPQLVSFLMDRGIVCVKCGEPFWGTLEELVSSKGKDVGDILKQINSFLKEK
jgi:methionine synthase II (cobalamin-independent)